MKGILNADSKRSFILLRDLKLLKLLEGNVSLLILPYFRFRFSESLVGAPPIMLSSQQILLKPKQRQKLFESNQNPRITEVKSLKMKRRI